MNILVVEDNFVSRRLLCRYLEPFGVPDVAVTGAEAVEAVHSALHAGRHYDLICLDIIMPGITGQEALTRIRALEKEHNLNVGMGAKVVMTTSLEDRENIRMAFRSSADGYVVKPIVKAKFLATLQDLGLEVSQAT